MRVPLQWLNEYVDLGGLTPETIAETLTNAGLEVESIETVGVAFSGVVLGHVLARDAHPNADKLGLVTVDLGPLGQNKVVCGASNVKPGMRIAYAQIGAQVLNRKDGMPFTLGAATIRGVDSCGMICSLDELGLQQHYTQEEDGIWDLTARTTAEQLGQPLQTVLGLSADTVLDVMPTANRGDLMSMMGVAREVAALFDRKLKLPEAPNPFQPNATAPFAIELTDSSVCEAYWGALLSGIHIQPAPQWMQDRLTHAGIRPINNVVDITNYVMLECGQPLHAFDATRLPVNGTLGVRPAKTGETLITLDDIERPLTPESVVITANNTPVALAGVMGGQSSKIEDDTQTVFIESAYFPPASNRKNARSVGMRTDSSARFERGVDKAGCSKALYRAIQLMTEYAGAECTWASNTAAFVEQSLEISLRLSHMATILGVTVPQQQVTEILTHLGFSVCPTSQPDVLCVTVPSFRRHDVSREIDLIEEVIRIYGYDSIPYTLPKSSAILEGLECSPRVQFQAVLQHTLTGSGLSEVMTHSLIGARLLRETGFTQNPSQTVEVTNSYSVDHTLLRHQLLPGLLQITQNNVANGNTTYWCFELGRVYRKTAEATHHHSGVQETLMLAGVLLGNIQQGQWHQAHTTDFYTVKGLIENLFASLGLAQQARWMVDNLPDVFHPGQAVQIKLGKQLLGTLGRLHPQKQLDLKLAEPLYLFELDAELLYQAWLKQTQHLVLHSISAFPAVSRDLAFVAPLTVSHQQISSALKQMSHPLLQDWTVFDEYKGQQVGSDARSLAYRFTLQSQQATLTEADIDAAMVAIRETLTQKLPITFR